ncbi:MAG: hypothetical protein JXL80_03110 [Planctomycetes bacterium]|nr:hypothetical protein [Planctomycetota bacterium]
MPSPSVNTVAVWTVIVLVCLAACAASAVLGALAAVMYDIGEWEPTEDWAEHDTKVSTQTGLVLGAVGGLAAGVLWSVRMMRCMRQNLQKTGRAVNHLFPGVGTSLLVAMGAAVFLHAGLMIAIGRFRPDGIIAGQIFAIPAGLILGTIAGLLLATAARRIGGALPDCEATEEP